MPREELPSEPAIGKPAAQDSASETVDRDNAASKPVPPSGVSEAKAKPCPHCCQITCKTEKDWRDKTKFWAEIFGLFVLIVYTIFTGLMYRANKKAAKAAADSATEARKTREQSEKAFGATVKQFQMDQRAWIAPHIIGQIFAEMQPFAITTQFNNTGKTPAIKVRTCQVAEVVELTQKSRFLDLTCPAGAYSPGYDIIFPGDHISRLSNAAGNGGKSTVYKDGLNREPLMDALRKGTKALYVYGRVEYCDVFKQAHWASFCSKFWIMPATPGGLPETHNWSTCEVGNDVDPVEDQPQPCHGQP